MILHNLPMQLSSFVGRSVEIAEIAELLTKSNCRLLTLVGFGGIGKTRLAVEVATKLEQSFSDGIYFVALHSITNADNIVSSIAASISLKFVNNTDLFGQLCNHLRDKQVLLIMDNFEHLLESANTVALLLKSAIRLKILITSREALRLREEWLYHVEGLSYPADDNVTPNSDDAIMLFAEHAGRVRRDFSLPDEYARVADICQLLEGIPLAIELAASWCRRLPCHEIVRELQRNLDILQTDLLNMPDRHRNMRTVFDHSWSLLTDNEQTALMGLTVFQGGFQRDAAEQIVGASRNMLVRLIDKSLLQVSSSGRYQMHELMRQYVSERLDEISAMKTMIYDQHCAYFCNLMDVPVGDFLGNGNITTLQKFDDEIDNMRLAWYWAIKRQRVSDLYRATNGIYWYTWVRNWHEEGSIALGQAVTMIQELEPSYDNQITLCHVINHNACMNIWLGPEARALARESAQKSLTILRSLESPMQLAVALGVLGEASAVDGELETAKSLLIEAIPILSATGQYELQGFYLRLLGRIGEDELDYDAYQHWHQQALLLGRRVGDQFTTAAALSALGNLSKLRGQYFQAQKLLKKSLSIAQAAELYKVTISPREKLGEIATIKGEVEAAKDYFEANLRSSP